MPEVEEPRVFDLTKHKELWTWLSEHPQEYKPSWDGWDGNTIAKNFCFACDFAGSGASGKTLCKNCPLIWVGMDDRPIIPRMSARILRSGYYCESPYSIYNVWRHANGGVRRDLAHRIANLKVVEGVPTK